MIHLSFLILFSLSFFSLTYYFLASKFPPISYSSYLLNLQLSFLFFIEPSTLLLSHPNYFVFFSSVSYVLPTQPGQLCSSSLSQLFCIPTLSYLSFLLIFPFVVFSLTMYPGVYLFVLTTHLKNLSCIFFIFFLFFHPHISTLYSITVYTNLSNNHNFLAQSFSNIYFLIPHTSLITTTLFFGFFLTCFFVLHLLPKCTPI